MLAEWLRKADKVWKKHRKSSSELLPWLNWQNKLIRQRPRSSETGVRQVRHAHLRCVVDARDVSTWRVHGLPVRGFIADYTTFWFETADVDERTTSRDSTRREWMRRSSLTRRKGPTGAARQRRAGHYPPALRGAAHPALRPQRQMVSPPGGTEPGLPSHRGCRSSPGG